MELVEINDLFNMDCGAPFPIVLGSDNDLMVVFFKDEEIDAEQSQESKDQEDSQVIAVCFRDYVKYSFGSPNNELLGVHPYSLMGIGANSFYEMKDSPLVEEQRNLAKKHPYYDNERWNGYRHFIITFHEKMFECVAMGFEVKECNVMLHNRARVAIDEISALFR